jgi:hypothetical protein
LLSDQTRIFAEGDIPMDKAIIERLEHLEQENRRLNRAELHLRRFFVFALVGLVVLMVSGAKLAEPPKVIEAQRFVLRDKDGIGFVELGMTPEGFPQLQFRDRKRNTAFFVVSQKPDGSPYLLLSQGGTSHIAMMIEEQDGTAILSLRDETRDRANLFLKRDGTTGLSLYEKDGTERVTLMRTQDGQLSFGFRNEKGKPRAGLRINETGLVGLNLYDDFGLEKVGLSAGPDGTSQLIFFDKQGKNRVLLDGMPSLNLADKDGIVRFVTMVHPDGRPALFLSHKDGKARIGLSVDNDGAPVLKQTDKGGKPLE